jgi:predicted DNA-binding transcriptional regulator AlpA
MNPTGTIKMSDVQTSLPTTGYLRLKGVLAFIPIGKTTWWEGVRIGKFPQPVKLGPRTTAWKVEDIRNLIQEFALQQGQQSFTSREVTAS